MILKVRWIGLPEAENKWNGQRGKEGECETHREKDCKRKSESERDGWIVLQGENIHLRETNRENPTQ